MDKAASGWISGFIGVVIFSGTLPATRLAVMDFDPVFLTCARAVIAALLAIVLLVSFRQKRPASGDLPSLALIVLGVVIGFPLLTSIALQYISSAHSLVFIGLLPLCTAIFAVLRGERPRPAFWLFSVLGSALVAGFAGVSEVDAVPLGDMLMLAAIVVCGLGYAEGARLSRRLGGWQVICWALMLSAPVMLPLAIFTMPPSFGHIGAPAWAGLAYISCFSMLIGMVFWYRGLALGGIAAVGQLQLLQPFLGLGFAAMLLGEPVSLSMLVTTLGVVTSVVGAKRFAT